jgi:hypothetical protein
MKTQRSDEEKPTFEWSSQLGRVVAKTPDLQSDGERGWIG